jgi:glycosyltransferase involved in cell wall biosynthesis
LNSSNLKIEQLTEEKTFITDSLSEKKITLPKNSIILKNEFNEFQCCIGYIDIVEKNICNADYLFLPSIQIENLSMSVIESFSVGVPVIASNVGAIKEICGKNNVNILFNPESVNDFRKKIIKIINEDIKKRAYKKKIVNNIFLKKFTALKMSKKYSLLIN